MSPLDATLPVSIFMESITVVELLAAGVWFLQEMHKMQIEEMHAMNMLPALIHSSITNNKFRGDFPALF